MIEEHLPLPFKTTLLGVTVTVERVDITADDRIVAVCRRDGRLQRIGILELPLPKPRPAGFEWIDAYRQWLGPD